MEETSTATAAQPTQTQDAPKKSEKGVKINYQAAAPIATEIKEQSHKNEQQAYDYPDNPYLYDTKGPRKQKNYGKIEDVEEDGTNVGTGTEAEWEGDSYKVTHKGEKFALRPSDLQQSEAAIDTTVSKLAQEEKELAEALDKIREMESRDQISFDRETQILEYLK